MMGMKNTALGALDILLLIATFAAADCTRSARSTPKPMMIHCGSLALLKPTINRKYG
ncbi:hypothetical protein [Niabella hirudinis]|uniref:hypothetical protein n=1 Tax=Niabella hirudinis TaxID=1285929 RepID=UPI003EC09D2C